ncbi:hypothetical protein BGX38DRAFT_856619 [Terfezia claveryi]|nr:hypothetical protein BGX38DRAFT_856619 [Terfezia claveryi]
MLVRSAGWEYPPTLFQSVANLRDSKAARGWICRQGRLVRLLPIMDDVELFGDVGYRDPVPPPPPPTLLLAGTPSFPSTTIFGTNNVPTGYNMPAKIQRQKAERVKINRQNMKQHNSPRFARTVAVAKDLLSRDSRVGGFGAPSPHYISSTGLRHYIHALPPPSNSSPMQSTAHLLEKKCMRPSLQVFFFPFTYQCTAHTHTAHPVEN